MQMIAVIIWILEATEYLIVKFNNNLVLEI